MSSIDVKSANTVEVGYDEFCGALAAHDLQALWSLQRKIMPDIPLPSHPAVALEVGHDLPAREARRRDHHDRARRRPPRARAREPGPERPARSRARRSGARSSTSARARRAPAHRHTPSAIRFVMTGSGVYTTVDGDACEMEPGDLILTPNWMWHDHNNYGDEPMVWFDGLDLPLMVNLESIFFENHPDVQQPVRGHGLSEQLYAAPGLAPAGEDARPAQLAAPSLQLGEHRAPARGAARARAAGTRRRSST